MPAYSGPRPEESLPLKGWRLILLSEGAYLVVTGVWPLVWMDGFLAATGPKQELWLVRTVGLLAAIIGSTLLLAAKRESYTPELAFLAVATAFCFLAVDVVGWAAGQLRWTYLLDAVVQGAFLLGWGLLAGYSLSEAG